MVGRTTSWISSPPVRRRFPSFCWYDGPVGPRVGREASSSASDSMTRLTGGLAGFGARWFVAVLLWSWTV